ncbi:MAG: prepilin-type N-terminal cleavage/methylation domain-containing protein [Deltaproteobacteria bacterium]|nr:prepilin-type N-terminal cleavage/methylation domain-containing protein [Deltaproteobacteria bacterium]
MNKDKKNQTGFTFIETIVALGITIFLILAMYAAYVFFFKVVTCEDLKIAAQQKARAATELMQREMRHAGNKVVRTASSIGAGLSETQMTFRYTDPVTGEMLRMTYRGNGKSLERERCVIDQATDIGDWNTCVGSFAFATVIDDLKSLKFVYYDKNGKATMSAAEVAYIKVFLEVETETECEDGIRPSVTIATESRPKNLW